MNKPAKTAAELMAQLHADPEFVARDERRRTQRDERIASYDAAARPVMVDLAAAGFEVESVACLYNDRMDYRSAIPVLLDWLPRVDHDGVKKSIVRALSVSWAKPHAAPLLLAEFQRPDGDPRSSLRWAIASALEVVAHDGDFEDLVRLANDRTYGRAREMIVVALGNMHDPEATDVLIQLLDDEEIAGHAVVALGNLGDARSRPHVERFLHHPKTWVREAARSSLDQIDAA